MSADFERYKELLRSTNREGIEDLITYLENDTDFDEAPASSKYHGSVAGGLCAHSLAVYDALVKIVDQFDVDHKMKKESLIIVALLHDLSKVNFYELYDKNVKVGDKWVKEPHYKIRDDRFIYSNHETTSMFIASQFINLTMEEQVAILHHMGNLAFDSAQVELSTIYGKYHLALYLHSADAIASIVSC